MISAIEARAITAEPKMNEEVIAFLNDVDSLIRDAAKNGFFKIVVPSKRNIEEDVAQALRDKGFSVMFQRKMRAPDFMQIFWKF